MRPIRLLGAAAALVTALLLSACAGQDLAFHQDHRLTFTAPDSRALVTEPVTLSWKMSDFTVVPEGDAAPAAADRGWFAVFVDTAPIRPGHTLKDVAKHDAACQAVETCPDADYLAQHGVYVTHEQSLVLDSVSRLEQHDDTQLHEVTVILLDSDGRRIGESAWYRSFKIKHKAIA